MDLRQEEGDDLGVLEGWKQQNEGENIVGGSECEW